MILPVAGIPVVSGLALSGTMTASVSGALLVSAEVLGVLAVAVMGKPGFLLSKYGGSSEEAGRAESALQYEEAVQFTEKQNAGGILAGI
jgi:hypothetical protein